MTPELTQEMRDALNANSGEVRVVDPNTQQVYVLVDDETHGRAMQALRRQQDLDAIQAGIDDMEAGRSMTIEQSKQRTEEALSRFKI